MMKKLKVMMVIWDALLHRGFVAALSLKVPSSILVCHLVHLEKEFKPSLIFQSSWGNLSRGAQSQPYAISLQG